MNPTINGQLTKPTGETFRLNYFVGGMLAYGGNFWIESSRIVFSPTGALDRAMGAKDVEINFTDIISIEYTGALSRTFHIKTGDKAHRFEGSQAKRVWDILQEKMPDKKVLTGVSAPASPCGQCSRPLQPAFVFCPYCGVRVKSLAA